MFLAFFDHSIISILWSRTCLIRGHFALRWSGHSLFLSGPKTGYAKNPKTGTILHKGNAAILTSVIYLKICITNN